jgi:hypothetical protein
MDIKNIILIIVIAVVIGLALRKMIKDKKSGNRCASCPYAGECTTCLTDEHEKEN